MDSTLKKTTAPAAVHIEKVETAEGALTFHCTVCQKTFGSRSQCYYHLNCGNATKKHKCDQCDQSFNSRSHLHYHLEAHSSNMHKCNQCGKEFRNRIVLEKHTRRHQSTSLPCAECNKVFRSKESLAAHVDQHKNNLRFKCTMCERKYATKCALQQHALKHMAKQHECRVCGKRFQRNSTLNLHLKRHSTAAESFACAICFKTFRDEHTLQRHGKLHEGSAKYKCKCDTTTARRDNMLRHVRNMHLGESFEDCVEVIPTATTTEKTDQPHPCPIPTTSHTQSFCGKPNTFGGTQADAYKQDQYEASPHVKISKNMPKTVENSSVIKFIGNVEPVKIPHIQNTHENTGTTIKTLETEKFELICHSPSPAILHKKLKKKYDPIEMYRKILLPADEEMDTPDHFEEEAPAPNSKSATEQTLPKPAYAPNFTHWRKNFKHTYEDQI